MGPLWLQLPPVSPCLLCSSQLLMGSRRLATEDQYYITLLLQLLLFL